MTDARLLLIDEASLGLSPRLVSTLFEVIIRLRDEGRSVLLVEQNANLALDVADRVYVMEKGRVVDAGTDRDRLAHHYFGGLDCLSAGPASSGWPRREGAGSNAVRSVRFLCRT